MSIEKNIENIKNRVKLSLEKSGRSKDDVKIVAVTKTRTVEEINEAVRLGLTHLGENRVQELLWKYDHVKGDVTWHLIGHLQRNKVKYIADKVSMIHSVDTLDLAKEIDRQAKKHNRVIDVLIEVNVSGEESKSGISPSEVFDFMEKASLFENIKIRGLMTMAPLNAPEDEIRDVFFGLSKISIDISKKKYDNISMDYLSMGMSNDFEIAIEEGSNIVRIGTALFK